MSDVAPSSDSSPDNDQNQPPVMLANPTAIEGTRFRLAVVSETTSTNTDLVRWCRDTTEPWIALRADNQTAGRGRRDRTWEAPPGSGLMMSVLFPGGDADHVHRCGALLGLAAHAACRSLGADVSMKWPNDLVAAPDADGTLPKLAGVLGEVVAVGTDIVGVVVGIGLNLRPVPDRDAALGRSVAVLDGLTDDQPSADEMARLVLTHLDRLLTRVEARNGVERLSNQMREASILLGRQVTVTRDATEPAVEGTAIDIDSAGRLVVDVDGSRVELSVGDVTSARLGPGSATSATD